MNGEIRLTGFFFTTKRRALPGIVLEGYSSKEFTNPNSSDSAGAKGSVKSFGDSPAKRTNQTLGRKITDPNPSDSASAGSPAKSFGDLTKRTGQSLSRRITDPNPSDSASAKSSVKSFGDSLTRRFGRMLGRK